MYTKFVDIYLPRGETFGDLQPGEFYKKCNADIDITYVKIGSSSALILGNHHIVRDVDPSMKVIVPEECLITLTWR